MKEIIEKFYESRIKQHEVFLSHDLNRGRQKYFFYIFLYIFVIFILGYAIFNLYYSPISGIFVPFFIIIGGIVTGILIYGIRKFYFKTSNKIPVKERIMNRLNLEENSGIDKRNIYAADWLYFVSIIIAALLYVYSFSLSNPSLMVIVSSVIMSLIIFLIYRAFLVHKTKLTKEFFIIKKPIIFQKTYIKWSDINSVKTTVKYVRDEHKADSYSKHHLKITTKMHEKPFKIYLGRKRNLRAINVLEKFFKYMIKLDQD